MAARAAAEEPPAVGTEGAAVAVAEQAGCPAREARVVLVAEHLPAAPAATLVRGGAPAGVVTAAALLRAGRAVRAAGAAVETAAGPSAEPREAEEAGVRLQAGAGAAPAAIRSRAAPLPGR